MYGEISVFDSKIHLAFGNTCITSERKSLTRVQFNDSKMLALALTADLTGYGSGQWVHLRREHH